MNRLRVGIIRYAAVAEGIAREGTDIFLLMSLRDTTTIERVWSGASDPEIAALEAELRAAQLGADVTALNRLIADKLLFTGPDGRLGTKAQDLEAHSSGVVRFRSHEPEELRVRRVGKNVAIAALRDSNESL